MFRSSVAQSKAARGDAGRSCIRAYSRYRKPSATPKRRVARRSTPLGVSPGSNTEPLQTPVTRKDPMRARASGHSTTAVARPPIRLRCSPSKFHRSKAGPAATRAARPAPKRATPTETSGAISQREIAPEVSVGVARFGAGLAARVAAGPAFDLWNFDGEQRNRMGGRATAVVEWPLARALMGSLRVTGVWSGSVLDPGDTPSGVERRATRRFGVALGLRYH